MKIKEKSKNVISKKVLGGNMPIQIPDSEELGKLEKIFHKLAKSRGIPIYGEREHVKFEGWFYKVEYDFWEKTRSAGNGKLEVLSYEDDVVSCFFRHEPEHKEKDRPKLSVGYTINTAYFEERIAFLRSLDNKIARVLAENKDPNKWPQCDEKRTFLSWSLELQNFGGIYPFLRAHINYTFKRH